MSKLANTIRCTFIIITIIFSAATSNAENYKFVTSIYPPFQYLEDGKPKGFKLDILREAFSRAGHTFEVDFLPWARVLKYIELGKADFTTGEWQKDRTEYATFSEIPLFNSTISLFTKKGSNIAYADDISALEKYAFITVNKYTYGRNFNNAIENGILTNIYSAPDSNSAVAMLHNNRGDILISNRHVAIAVARHANIEGSLVELTPPISISPTHVIYTKERDLRRLSRLIDKALLDMTADGTMERLNNY